MKRTVFRTTKRSKSRALTIIGLLSAVVSSLNCSSCGWESFLQKPPIDRSILTNEPCAVPCWQGIIPGQTSTSEAWDILTRLEFLDHARSPWRGKQLEQGVEWIAWRTLAGGPASMGGNLFAYQGVVAQIEVDLDFGLSLKEVLDRYGSPDKVQAFSGASEIASIMINYYYPQQGLIFVSLADDTSGSDLFTLESATPVTTVYYFRPTSIDELFIQLPDFTRTLPFGMEGIQDWPGFSPIEVTR